MMSRTRSKVYVPDPTKWINFYRKKAESGKTFKQTGAGLLTIDDDNDLPIVEESGKNKLAISLVSPAQQVVERAKSELVRQNVDLRTIKNVTRRKRKHGVDTGNIVTIPNLQEDGDAGNKLKITERKKPKRTVSNVDTSGF